MLYQEAVLNLDEAKFVLENDFAIGKCNCTKEEKEEIKINKPHFVKKWAYESCLVFEDTLDQVLFVVNYLKYAKGYNNYLRAINEKGNDQLDKFSTLAFYELPLILKKIKPMIVDFNEGLYSPAGKPSNIGRPKTKIENADLNQVEAAKLFLALSNVKVDIPSNVTILFRGKVTT